MSYLGSRPSGDSVFIKRITASGSSDGGTKVFDFKQLVSGSICNLSVSWAVLLSFPISTLGCFGHVRFCHVYFDMFVLSISALSSSNDLCSVPVTCVVVA